jgi:hypothetical protein
LAALKRCYSALHEAGHVVTATLLGCGVSSVWIAKTEKADWFGTPIWEGQAQILTSGTSPAVRRMIGAAGAIAEGVWVGEPIDCWDFLHRMSPSDFAFGPRGMSDHDIVQDDPGKSSV